MCRNLHTYMLKNKSFWAVRPPSHCSWYWRKILKLRHIARPMIKHRIGNGRGTFLWYDNWHPLGPLLDKFGPRVVYDVALGLHARVSTVIEGDWWHWPLTNTLELMEIRDLMTTVPSPSDTSDSIIWVPSPNGKFSTSHTWATIRAPGHTIHWYYLVWFSGHLPRHSIVLWFAILNRLSTHDRISLFMPGPLACTLCHKGMESHDHLFFTCPYSTFVWQGIQHRLGMTIPATSWDAFITWVGNTWKLSIPGMSSPESA